VTTALLFGTESAASDRLRSQLRSVGVDDVRVVSDVREVASLARSAAGTLLVGYGDVVTHTEALAALLHDPRVPSGILASDDVGVRPGAFDVRTDRGRVLSVGSPFHAVGSPNHSFLGFLKVAAEDSGELAAVADRLASLGGSSGPAGWPAGDVPALLSVGLVRSGVRLSLSFLRELFWARPGSDAERASAESAMAAIDEEQVKLDSAVKAMDGFFTTFFVSPYSKYIARWAARHGLTPNQVTTVSMAVGVLAAVAFASGSRWGLVAGALLLQLAFTLDCVDGQLARYTLTFTKFGAWLDSVFDRAKEYVVYVGLAVGGSAMGEPVWLLAGAALTLQTVRHSLDFSFAASEQHSMAVAPQRPLDDPSDGTPAARRPAALPPQAPRAAAAPPASARILGSWRRLNRLPGLIWVKRVIVFPIGERFAATSITAALSTPRTTFVVLIAWGGLAALYGLAGRLLRSTR
jgi:phosphatidylglycerophosphate synthase